MNNALGLNPQTWVVVPAYNEEQYLALVINKIKKYTHNIIIVDDGSSDTTASVAHKLTSVVISHPVNLGKGGALKTGCDYAFNKLGAQNVILIDSDDQHDPAELMLFDKKLSQKYQVVFGIRGLTLAMPFIKRIGSLFLSILIYLLYGKYFIDVLSGYKAFSKSAYSQIRWQSNDYAVELEIIIRVAKSSLKKTNVIIKTIYHDHDRGMTMLDAMHFLALLFNWRVTI